MSGRRPFSGHVRWLFRGAWRTAAYGGLRLVGRLLYPIAGARAPLRGVEPSTIEYARVAGHQLVPLDPEARSEHPLPPGEEGYTCPPTFVALIPHARVLGDGIVVAPHHTLLADVARNFWGRPHRNAVLFRARLPPTVVLSGNIAVLSSSQHQNYFHWMFDVLPRVDLVERSRVAVDRYLVNNRLPFQRESLDALGLAADRIIPLTSRSHFAVENLVVPSLPGPRWPSSRSAAFLRARLMRGERLKPERRIYVSRGDARQRRVINEEAVAARLRARGFEIVQLTGLSLRSQIDLFSSAAIVVGAHGAGFTNLVFCNEGASVVEFMPDLIDYPYFEMLSRIRSLRYVRLTSKSQPETLDHVVDLSELDRSLASLGTR